MAKRQRQEKRELSPYQQKLLDPRWQKKRLEIFERDEWMCQACGDCSTTLHVHHTYYERDKDPWEYPAESLVTLCMECHEGETNGRGQAEHELLHILRRKGFDAYDLRRLSSALEGWQFIVTETDDNYLKRQVNIAMLAWTLSNTSIQHSLWDQLRSEAEAWKRENDL
jgi:hypothetical protein